jgi:hypothetical protein
MTETKTEGLPEKVGAFLGAIFFAGICAMLAYVILKGGI